MVKDIFVNLPIKDLSKTMEFFKKLGFTFDPKFTDNKAGALVLGDHIYAMLLTEPFFKSFIKKEVADSSKTTEAIMAIGVESREKVDELCDKAMEAGATKYKEADDYGWMYCRAFQDLDGHLWEVLFTDMSKFPKS
ncbi:VOC family protein [soil metagenome]